MNIPAANLCRAAGVGRQTYRDAVERRTMMRPATLARLNAALRRFQLGFGGEEVAPHAAYRACLVLAAFVMKTDPRAVLSSDPGKRATLDPHWKAAAHVRRVGYYIANQFLGFSQVDLARAAGVTRQNISDAMRAFYDQRDTDPELNAVLGKLEEIFE